MPRAHLSLLSYVESVKPPWVSLLVLKGGQKPETMIRVPDGFRLVWLKGAKCRTPAGLFEECARALRFPDYFGHNWDALEECLADLEWLPAKGYLVVIIEAEQVLADDEEAYATFVEVLSDAAETWAAGQVEWKPEPTPFHALLAVSAEKKSRRDHWGVPEIAGTAPRRKKAGKSGR
ncbi:MAG TPA: barstar family protein [Nitrospira sp.]|nr:barstar family protein [Nitrospira sp.]